MIPTRYLDLRYPYTCDFTSCSFPKFKASAGRGTSRKMTYVFGFYGPKIGGGGPPTRLYVQKHQRP